MKSYSVKEVFGTLQGEGVHAGKPAVFVRFTGCNLWSGVDETRERDALRNDAVCPRWCDTDFAKGDKLEELVLVDRVAQEATLVGMPHIPLVVFTGGEPFLQLSQPLLRAMRHRFPDTMFAVETNGSQVPSPSVAELVNWVTVSPKQSSEKIRLRVGSELKVVWPGGAEEPESFARAFGPEAFQHYFVSPLAETLSVGRSLIVSASMQQAAKYVMAHPRWKLTLQMHKVIGLP